MKEFIEIRSRRTGKNLGIFSRIAVNARDGIYRIVATFDHPTEEKIVAVTKGKPFMQILSLRPGKLAVIEPVEIT